MNSQIIFDMLSFIFKKVKNHEASSIYFQLQISVERIKEEKLQNEKSVLYLDHSVRKTNKNQSPKSF